MKEDEGGIGGEDEIGSRKGQKEWYSLREEEIIMKN